MAGFNIMLIEDAGIIVSDIEETLQGIGVSIPWVFSSAESALEALEENTPDLILMDIELSGEMDGIEATHQICEQWDIPVIFLTAYSNEATTRRVKDSGALAFLIKPLEKRDMLNLVEWILGGYDGPEPSIARGHILRSS